MVAKRGWKNKLIDMLLTVMSGHVVSATNDDVPLGLKLHVADIYIEEIERVSQGEVINSVLFISLKISPHFKCF